MLFLITLLTFLVTGTVPPVIAHYLFRVRFLGGTWAALLVGTIAAIAGGVVATSFLSLPEILVLGNAIDVVPPLAASTVVTVVYALVSLSNR
jgi:uncharacterized membrane protein YeaQ/YmgE (transglycosylase-associated protein family)